MALTFGGKRRPGGTGPRTPLDPLEQQVTERVAAVMRALAKATDVDAFARAIADLNPDLLEQLLADINVGQLGQRIEDILRQVIVSGGSAEAQRIIRDNPRPGPNPFDSLQTGIKLESGIIVPASLAPPPDIDFTVGPGFERGPDGRLVDTRMFDFIDQRAVDWARTRSAQLVTEIDQSNRLAIRRTISESFTKPATVDQTARKLRQIVGLHSRWANAVLKFDDANYVRFIKDGMTPDVARAKADTLTERYRNRLIRRRAEMIARTEIQSAQNFARQAAWDAGAKTGYVDTRSMKEWRTAPLGSSYGPPCPICAEMRGRRVPWNGTFASGHSMPPAHPHCRCTAVLVPPSRGLEGLPSQDMGSWLDQLDAMDAAYAKNAAPGPSVPDNVTVASLDRPTVRRSA